MKKKDVEQMKCDNQIVESNNKVESTKKKTKEPKTVLAKKLPLILKKNYSQKKFDKFLKRIYIPEDKKLVEKYFVQNPAKEDCLYIPRDKEIVKKDFTRLKKIGKDVASHKPGVKFVPLLATVASIFVIFSLVVTFRNVVARKIITYAMESTFGAKTDIAYLNLYLTDGNKLGYVHENNRDKWYLGIQIKGLEQGYVAEPMKNLFEISETNLAVNLTELTRGKCDIKEIKIVGVNFMTPRKTSAYLKKYAKNGNKFPMQAALEEKAKIAEAAAIEELQKMFEQYNPEKMLKDFESQLKTPDAAKQAYDMGDAMVKKWQSKPDEISKQVTDFTNQINDIVNTDWSNVKDVTTIKENLEKINSAIQDGKKIAEETKTVVKEVQSDSAKVTESANKLTKALDSDSKFVQNEVNKIKNFKLTDGLNLISGPIDSILYKTIGKYYPYMKKGIGMAMSAKASAEAKPASSPKPKKEKKEAKHKRQKGVDVYYKGDNVPKFLIEKMEFAGGETSAVQWSGIATNISNNMDKRGLPACGNVKIIAAGQTHSGDVVVDARSYSKEPLVKIDYSGNNYPIGVDTPQFKMASLSTISGRGTVDDTGSFSLGATLFLKNLEFETEKFDPEFAYNIYSRAMAKLTQLSLGIDFMFDMEDKFDLKLSTDADKQLARIMQELLQEEIELIKTECENKLAQMIDDLSKDSNLKINEFLDIKNGINSESIKLDKANAKLEEKKKELTAKLKQEASDALSNSIGTEAKENIGNVLQGLGNLKGLRK